MATRLPERFFTKQAATPVRAPELLAVNNTLAAEMGLDAEGVQTIGTTGLVCDWGMMHLPEDIRGVKRQLDERERFD